MLNNPNPHEADYYGQEPILNLYDCNLEKISSEEFGIKKILAIAGVGAREYFRKFGYANDGAYVSKILK